jgi:hypothetical protein
MNQDEQMNRNLVGSTYGRLCIKFSQSRMKGERHRLSPLSRAEPLVILSFQKMVNTKLKQELPVAAMFANESG